MEKVNEQFGQVLPKGGIGKVKAEPEKGKKRKRKANDDMDILEAEIAQSCNAFDNVIKQYSSGKSFKSIASEIVDLTGQEEDEEGKEESSSNRRSSKRKAKKKMK